MLRTSSKPSNNVEQFKTFFQNWLIRQEYYLHELLQSTESHEEEEEEEEEEEQRVRELIKRVIAHYTQCYKAKSRLVKENVFLLFSPTWFTSLEHTFLWIAGFKPGLAFRLVNNSVLDLSEEQLQRIERLKADIKEEEIELANQLARVQESVAAPPILEHAMRAGRAVDGEFADAVLRSSMEMVEITDDSRGKTVMKIVEILSSAQSARFLAAAAQLHLQIRHLGLQREAERRGNSS